LGRQRRRHPNHSCRTGQARLNEKVARFRERYRGSPGESGRPRGTNPSSSWRFIFAARDPRRPSPRRPPGSPRLTRLNAAAVPALPVKATAMAEAAVEAVMVEAAPIMAEAIVMEVSMRSPLARPAQLSHRPAKANGRRSANPIQYSCLPDGIAARFSLADDRRALGGRHVVARSKIVGCGFARGELVVLDDLLLSQRVGIAPAHRRYSGSAGPRNVQ
jgi:hypothetical protein